MTTPVPTPFPVAITADFYADGRPKYRDLGLEVLAEEPRIRPQVLPELTTSISPEQLAGVNAVLVLTPRVDVATVSRSEDLLAVVRFGVGYDAVDVAACTAADVAVIISAGAVDRPVAEATVAWMLALSHQMLIKDRLLRQGRWDDRSLYMGSELRDRTLGVIGLGGIAQATLQLLASFGMRPPLAYDPWVTPAVAKQCGATLVSLDELLATSDYVSIHCPLTPDTRNLIGAASIARMKPTAFLINTARGGIVDEDALYEALVQRRIAGAALDCFENEPITSPHRFGDLENVILAPHSIAWTDELFRDVGRTASRAIVDLARGIYPRGVVNSEVFERRGFQTKWTRIVSGSC